jgi:sugar (pentulose or hexulose) kinase
MYDVQRQVVTREPRMYNFNVLKSSSKGPEALEVIANKSPMGSSVRAATSTLPKLLSWHMESPVGESERLMCQADYVAHQLLSADDKPEMVLRSDWHNALKLGYDVRTLQYPDWLYGLLKDTGIKAECLPAVSQPGSVYKTVSKQIADRYGLPQGCEVVAGTTDSIAAFLAAGVSKTGQAVTSLGSTLAVKLLSDVYCEDSDRGVYSHRLGDMWLVGGASNVGCKILRQEKFSNDELAALSEGIDPAIDSPLGRTFYPLPEAGERFPVYDPSKEPVLAPKPASRGEYLHGILQSIAHIEDDGYRALVELGASPVTEVRTCGGGAANDKWAAIRQRLMGVPVTRAPNTDAAYGCARLGILYAGNNADKETPIEAAPAALQ